MTNANTHTALPFLFVAPSVKAIVLIVGKPARRSTNIQQHANILIQVFWIIVPASGKVVVALFDTIEDAVAVDLSWSALEISTYELCQLNNLMTIVSVTRIERHKPLFQLLNFALTLR